MPRVKWSIHRDDSKIGEVEEIGNAELAQRYVDTGMATYVDAPAVASGTSNTVAIAPASTDAGKTDDTDGPNVLSKAADGKAAPTAKPR